MNTGFTNNITMPSLNGLVDIDADSVNSSSVSTTTLILDGVDVGNQVATNTTNIATNTTDITTLKQITTGQSYTSGTDTTTFDNKMIITGTLSITGNILEPTITANSLIISPVELSCLDSIGSNIQTQLNNKVNLTGAETINGVKTFGSVPICTTLPPSGNYLANKSYVDSVASSPSTITTTTMVAPPNIYYFPYVTSSTGTSSQIPYVDGNISFDKPNNTLRVPNLSSVGTFTITNATANVITTGNTVDLSIRTKTVDGGNVMIAPQAGSFGLTVSPTAFTSTLATTVQTSNGQSSVSSLIVKDGTTTMNFIPNIVGGGLNAFQSAGDSLIYCSGSAKDTGILSLSTWSTYATGVKISSATVLIGAGGTTNTPSGAFIRLNGGAGAKTIDVGSDVYFQNSINIKDKNSPFNNQFQIFASGGVINYDATATSSTHYFAVRDATPTVRVPLQITSAGLNLTYGSLNIGTGTLLTVSQQLANQYQIVNNATSGTIEFYVFDAIPSIKNPLTLSSSSITSSLTQPASTDSSTIIPTTAWVQSAISTGVGSYVTTGTTQTISGQKTFTSNYNYFNNLGIVAGYQLTLQDSTNLKTTNIFQSTNDAYIYNNVTSGSIYFQTRNSTPATTTPLQLSSALCSFNNTDVEINNTKNLTLKTATKLILADGTPTTQIYQSGNNTEIYNATNSGIININSRSAILGIKVPVSIDVQTVTMRAGVNIANVATPVNFTTMIQDGNTPSQFNILNNVTSGIITMSCEDNIGTARDLLNFRTTQTVIGGDGTDFNHLFMSDGTPASTTAKVVRIASSTASGFSFIDSGIGQYTGTYPLAFRSGGGTEWLRFNDTGIKMNNTCMYGRNDGFAFATIPTGATTQPIGYSFTTSTVVTVSATTNTTVTANLNAGVWLLHVTWQLTRGSGTFTTSSFLASSMVSGTGYNFVPNQNNASFRFPIPPTTVASTMNANFTSTIVVTGTAGNVNPVINTAVSMTIGTATSTLYIGYTKIA